MELLRRRLLAATVCAVLVERVHAVLPQLPEALSLLDELHQALATGNPLLVMVSLEGCPFCRVAREHYLIPMHDRQGLPVAQVDMRSKKLIKNFQGIMQTHDDWIRSMQVRVAPTILFFGRGGVELVERMSGGYIPDFYGAYLDERLRQAKVLLAS